MVEPTQQRRAAALRRNLARRKAAARAGDAPATLFMVAEHFTQGPAPVWERLQAKGELLPQGLRCVSSWLEPSGQRRFQLMEAENADLFATWTAQWDDLVSFEITPVLIWEAFWAAR